MPTRCLLFLVAILFAFIADVGFAAGDPYLGIRHEQVEDPPGLLVSVVAGAPAALSGLKTDDIITEIAGIVLGESDRPYSDILTEEIAKLEVGDVLPVVVYRDSPRIVLTLDGEQVFTDWPLIDLPELIDGAEAGELIGLTAKRHAQEIKIDLVLGVRPGTEGEPFPPNEELTVPLFTTYDRDLHPEVRLFLDELIQESMIQSDCDDLFGRLDTRASPDDGFKLKSTVALLRDGLRAEYVTRSITDYVESVVDKEHGGDSGWFYKVHDEGYPEIQNFVRSQITQRSPLESWPWYVNDNYPVEVHLTNIEDEFSRIARHIKLAFADFTDDELAFIAEQRDDLTEVFRQVHYINEEDDDPRRIRGNLRLVELAKRIDFAELLHAQYLLSVLSDQDYLACLQEDLIAEFDGRLDEDILLERDTEFGKFIISGTGHTWHKGEAPAMLIDLGGDDFYTTTAGSGVSLERPIGVLIDFGGNDAYETTTHYSQGSGSMGVGLLIDCEGDDQYVGLQWAQGCGYFGCGALLDMAGDDIYRGEEFCQAAAIFGTGILIDYTGDDRMEGQMKSQAFGGAKAVALLIDVAGDDYRYCKGKYPTGYGDPGIFDAWGQGCAQGFRGYASGGIAGVIDMGGKDYNEAGNFSQGGGYYFGYGFFHDMGWEDDVYIGSRYNQGFSAHQAVGVFLEDGGDDRYHTRQAVAQGLAWDECCTIFIDYGGDDTYEGGTGFSQGASAHNSLSVMWDRGGRDSYDYAAGQARAGGNDYHGGTSLSLFIDEGGDLDWYSSEKSGNDLVNGWPEHGFFADLPGSLDEALTESMWRRLWVYEKD